MQTIKQNQFSIFKELISTCKELGTGTNWSPVIDNALGKNYLKKNKRKQRQRSANHGQLYIVKKSTFRMLTSRSGLHF